MTGPGRRILVVAPSKREAAPVVTHLRAGGHVVSLVDDLEAAHELLASRGFDQAVIPAPVMASLLEQAARWGADEQEALRQATLGVFHDLHILLAALDRCIGEVQEEKSAPTASAGSLIEARRRVTVLSAYLHELIDELADGGRHELRLTTIELEEAIEAAAVSVYPLASDRRLRLVIDVEEGLTYIRADRTLLKRILTNLLQYAAGHAPTLGTVAVTVQRENGHCLIAVSDNGEGISQSELRKLFSRVAEPEDGGGAGLSRVKRAVEQHGGRIWVESQKGTGTTVFVSVPNPIDSDARSPRSRSARAR